jgi:hypothetical protein
MRTPTPPRPTSKPLTPDEHVAAWNGSGLTARSYAEKHGLKASSLYSWRRSSRARNARHSSTPRILPVVVAPSLACEVALPDGRTLRFPESLPAARLRAFLDAMERP